jgi:tetratricopeptide (TPR) repeat protein
MKNFIFLIFITITSVSYSQNDYLLGENYYREGEYEKATQIFTKLYSNNPFNTSYLSRLISCYQETDQFLKAERLLKSIIKKNPKQGFLYVYLGYNYERQQQKELAQDNYNLALKSLNKSTSFGGIIGRIFKDYNLLDNSILAYEKAMSQNKNVNYSFQIAQIYGEKGDFKKMFEAYINLVDILLMTLKMK